MRRQYTAQQKQAIIAKMMEPNNMSVPEINQETGVPLGTLYKWRGIAQAEGLIPKYHGDEPKQWRSEDKFRMVVETMPLSEAELSEYCRSKGIYPEQIAEWKLACMGANSGNKAPRTEQKRVEKELAGEVKALKKELRIKEKALAETAAILTLRKKLNAIWGESEDE